MPSHINAVPPQHIYCTTEIGNTLKVRLLVTHFTQVLLFDTITPRASRGIKLNTY
jgi:hypothetical protein